MPSINLFTNSFIIDRSNVGSPRQDPKRPRETTRPQQSQQPDPSHFRQSTVFSAWQTLASHVLDRACCLSYSMPMDFYDDDNNNNNSNEYCQRNNSILHESEFLDYSETLFLSSDASTTVHEIHSLRDGNEIRESVLPSSSSRSGSNHVISSVPTYNNKGSRSRNERYTFDCGDTTTTVRASQSKSVCSLNSLPTVMTCSTAWSDEEDDDMMDHIHVNNRVTLRDVEPQAKPLPPTTATPSSNAHQRREHVRRWSGIDKDITEDIMAAEFYQSQAYLIRRVQSESLADLPFLSVTEGYEI